MSGSIRKSQPSIVVAQRLSDKHRKDKYEIQDDVKVATHIVSWVFGIIFALLPLVFFVFGYGLHYNDTHLQEIYVGYIKDFFKSGSFLWVSITILVMSLLDLVFYGMRKNNSAKRNQIYMSLICLSFLCVLIGIYIYTINIEHSINNCLMYGISVFSFILFAVLSWIISFKM